jgi:hypothetical protein
MRRNQPCGSTSLRSIWPQRASNHKGMTKGKGDLDATDGAMAGDGDGRGSQLVIADTAAETSLIQRPKISCRWAGT